MGGFLLHSLPDLKLGIGGTNHPSLILSIMIPQGRVGCRRTRGYLTEGSSRGRAYNIEMVSPKVT